MRLLKALTLFLALAGAIALLLAARFTARPLTALSTLNPAMDFAYVRIQGRVLDYPILSRTERSLSFRVQDASGDIRVNAYRATVDALLARQRVPLPGDWVTLDGTLRIRDNDASLVLNAPEALDITQPDFYVSDLVALDALPLGDCVTLLGQVRRISDAGTSLRLLSLRKDSAQAEVVLPLSLPDLFGQPPAPQVGDWLRVAGCVGEYHGKRQLLPRHADDLTPAAPLAFDVRPLSALGRPLLGEWVAVQGRVEKLRPLKNSVGMLVDLSDAAQQTGKSITVVMFEAWQQIPFSTTLQVGDTLMAQGELVDYHGQLEIQPELSVDVVLVQHQ
jgi:DNA/RNA endonuclease YhcR with UshA esterase domain